MNIAVIPARGGSKRIPRKNIRFFCGKPIIAYTIDALKNSGVIDRIWVSTDDEEIAEVAKGFGAEIPYMRPMELSDDYTGTTAVMDHAVKYMKDKRLNPSSVCCALATAPLMQGNVIKEALEKLSSKNWQYVFTATRFNYPIWRSFEHDDRRGIKMFYPEKYNNRSQDLPVAWHDAGQFYWGLSESWLQQKPLFSPNSTFLELPSFEVVDIDEEEDWIRAELLYKLIHS